MLRGLPEVVSEQGGLACLAEMVVFRKDPCGIICLMMTYLSVFYADYVVVRWIVIQTMQGRCVLLHYLRSSCVKYTSTLYVS